MPSFPESDASSSDLYSSSESVQEDASHQLVGANHGYGSTEEQKSHIRGSEEAERLPESYTNGSIERLLPVHMSPQDPRISGIPNEEANSVQNKRKRGDVENILQEVQMQDSEPDGSDQDSSRTVSLDSLQQSMADDGSPIRDNRSRIKRPKIEKQVKGLPNGRDEGQPTGLPAEIWQHVFSFVPPVFLGRLLRVDRAFNSYLTSAANSQPNAEDSERHAIRDVSADDIWVASRKRFAPGLPRPNLGLTELERWRLLRGRQCQICGEAKVQNFATSSESPLESGPGDKGVRESTMFASPDCPYFLLAALPFAFVTATNHFVSNAALQGMAHLPPLRMEKHYFKPHVEDIKKRLNEARNLGAASADEWFKGLPTEGKARIDDATRWEQWEFKGGLKKINVRPPPKVPLESTAAKSGVNDNQSKGELRSEWPPTQLGSVSGRLRGGTGVPAPLETGPSAANLTPHLQPSRSTPAPYADAFPQRPTTSFPQPRIERSIQEVNEAKSRRKAEIERRCAGLDPPLSSSILNHMDSFQAAIQISQPLTDHAWEVLKPRLLAQRPYAEKKEEEKVRQDELLQEEYRQRRQQEAQLKETKETLDREWDTIQVPVRNKIGALADEIIAENWSHGESVSKDTCPKFAADVLIYVRERFYADIAREDEATRAAGESVKVDQANEPPTRKLILENMKWLFDTKIKPLTENYQKELFLCNGCDGNFKFYGFEGVVQHFAAKHTTALSMGSVVVHWRAEWPEHPPFNPNPSAAKATYYNIPTPVNAAMQAPPSSEGHSQAYHGGYVQPAPEYSAPPASYDSVVQPPSSAYTAPYATPQQNGAYHYPPAHAYQHYGQIPQPEHTQGTLYQGSNMYPPTPQSYNSYPSTYSQPYSQPTGPTYGTPYGQTQYPNFTQAQEYPRPGSYGPDHNGQYYGPNAMAPQSATYPPRPAAHPSGLAPEVYQKQLDELAKQAREVWFGTSGIKDIPQSVRIYVVIHQVASRFAATYINEPSLAMFIDGLDNHAKMRPVRSLNGLACKTCVSGVMNQQHSVQSPVADRKLYTLPHLLNHFRSAHVEDAYAVKDSSTPQDPMKPDWKRDMIELPDLSLIANLLNASGMDDAKLGLVAAVFPEAFPAPLPRVLKGGNTGPLPAYKNEYGLQKGSSHLAAKQPSSLRVGSRDDARNFSSSYYATQVPSPRVQSTEPPGEDEYDPTRPAFLSGIDTSEPSSAHPWDGSQYQSPNTSQYPQYGNGPSHRSWGAHQGEQSTNRAQRDSRYNDHPNGTQQQRSHDLNSISYNENTQAAYGQIIQNGSGRSSIAAKQATVHSKSPSEAADQFLDNFSVSRPLPSSSYPKEGFQRSRSAWQDEAISQDQQQAYSIIANLEKWKAENQGAEQVPDNQSTIDSIRAAQSISRAVDDLATQGAVSRPPADDEYRPPSQVQISPVASRPETSPRPYDARGPSRQSIVEPQCVMNDPGHQEKRGNSYYQPRDAYYRSRSRSPQTVPTERAYYRARSPMEERRQEHVYRVISPPMRQEPQIQRIIRSEYPAQPRYQYVEDRAPAEDRYGRRVEYVPVRYEEHGSAEPSRYVYAQPVEEPAPPQGYVRVAQNYGGQQIYERNRQTYHAEPAGYYPEPYRGPQVYTQEYRY